MPRNGRCTGPRNPARARSRYAKAVDEPIRRADADETRAGNSQNRQAAVVRTVSVEGAVRFRRRRKGRFRCQLPALQTDFIIASLNLWLELKG